MRCACIDVGSNTTRLLVAEPAPVAVRNADPAHPAQDPGRPLVELLARRSFTRLGADRGPDGSLHPDRIRQTAEAAAAHAEAARALGAHPIRVVATAAVRLAPNGEALCEAVRAATGLPMEVLTGEQEARHAFHGATACVGRREAALRTGGAVGVVDVGGGSTELVVGTMDGPVTWSVSLPIGSGVLTDLDGPEDIEGMRAVVDAAFAGIRAPRPAAALAVGGSAASLGRVLGPLLSTDGIDEGLALVAAGDIAGRFDLHAERARMLPAGLLLLRAATVAFGAPLRIAGGGLREGIIMQVFSERSHDGNDGATAVA